MKCALAFTRTPAFLLALLALLAGCSFSRVDQPVHAVSRNEALRRELLAMCDVDQRSRAGFNTQMAPEEMAIIERVDAVHTARMKKIVEQHGWPGRSLVGEDGAHAAWLLVQHASTDFMVNCLPLLERAAKTGEASAKDYAYLFDRVRMNQSQPQVYGTQFKSDSDGKLVLHPIEDAEHVDERRRSIGLEPLAEYERALRKAFER
jgi:hypothetical protein